jgi:dienelactone hydrolase
MSEMQLSAESNWDWEKARRTAFVQDILAAFTQRPADLLPFEEVRRHLGLLNLRYLGVQDVPLANIIGSVGRYRDFTRAFFPRSDDMRDRWRQIDGLSVAGDLPPVELYKVSNTYYVRDGNHRVSVARQQKIAYIQAYVWEYETRASLKPDTDINDLLCKAAHAAFMERTNLDRLYPDLSIELSQPDGYDELLYEIEAYQHIMSRIDEREVPFDEAVMLWYEMRYTPIVEIIRQRDILSEFSCCTEADLYLWLCRSQEELDVRYSHQVLMEDAAGDLSKRFGQKRSPAQHVKKAVGRVVGSVGELGGRLVESLAPRDRARVDDEMAAALLAPVRCASTGTPRYRFQGTTQAEWETWHAEFRERLWDLLGVGDRPWQPYGPSELNAEVEERVAVGGLWRELVWLSVEQALWLPVYLFLPQEAKLPRPAVVIFPGHGTIAQAAGLEKSYQRANALELARAGFVTLAVEPRGFGKLGAVGHLQIDAAARLVARTWYGLLIRDGMRAIDYLATRPEVDGSRLGAAGIGAGGALAMYTAALDERIRAAFVNSYLGKYIITSLEEEHCPCNDIPGILCHAEMGDVASLIAPRPVMFVNGQRDPSTGQGTQESFAVVRHMYEFLGVHRHARLIEPEEMGHYFDNQLAIGWLGRWLGLIS